MQYQVENGTLRELIVKLFAENDSLRGKLDGLAAHMNTQSVPSTRNPLGWSSDWNNYTRQYLFLVAPWPPNAAFGMAARPSIDPNSPARYTNDDMKRAAEAAELYDLIPHKYHPIISRIDSGFATTVWQRYNPHTFKLLTNTFTVPEEGSRSAIEPSRNSHHSRRANLRHAYVTIPTQRLGKPREGSRYPASHSRYGR